MNTIEPISGPGPVRRALRPRTFFALLLAATALCGCARRYDLTLTNGGRVTNVRKLTRSKEGGSYSFIAANGQKFTIPASRVLYTGPHGDTNWMFNNQQ